MVGRLSKLTLCWSPKKVPRVQPAKATTLLGLESLNKWSSLCVECPLHVFVRAFCMQWSGQLMESVLLCCNFMGCVYADLGTQGDCLTPLNRLSTNSNVISSYPKYLTSQEKIWAANSLCPSLCGFACQKICHGGKSHPRGSEGEVFEKCCGWLMETCEVRKDERSDFSMCERWQNIAVYFFPFRPIRVSPEWAKPWLVLMGSSRDRKMGKFSYKSWTPDFYLKDLMKKDLKTATYYPTKYCQP